MEQLERRRTALLITFYWPPAGGPGVHRWLRFSRFFRQNNWDLHVYCPQDAHWPVIDEELMQEIPQEVTVVRRPVFEPTRFLGKQHKSSISEVITKDNRKSLLQRLVVWVRGNLFIPDARVFWIAPSVRFLHRYLREHPEIDTIISTGPPHSLHLIGRKLKQTHPHLVWVADFRDPWTEIDFYQDLMMGKRADSQQKKLEKAVLTEADLVISVSKACADGLEAIGQRRVDIVTNGFVFPEFDPAGVPLDEQFTIAHFGSMPFSRNPEVLWKALAGMLETTEHFSDKLKIRLVGQVSPDVMERLLHYGLEQFLELIPQVAHKESVRMQRSSQVLLLVGNNTGNVKGILTGKFFEYLGAKRPIFTIGQAGSNLEEVMAETQAGAFISYEEEAAATSVLAAWFDAYLNRSLYSTPVNTEQFSSAAITRQLLELIEKIPRTGA